MVVVAVVEGRGEGPWTLVSQHGDTVLTNVSYRVCGGGWGWLARPLPARGRYHSRSQVETPAAPFLPPGRCTSALYMKILL